MALLPKVAMTAAEAVRELARVVVIRGSGVRKGRARAR